MNYRIYQLKNTHTTTYSFMGYDFAIKSGFNLDDYKYVYSGNIAEKNGSVLDQIFEQLNMNRPSDFTGHSLSVSDIIVISNGDSYYVDRIGFKYLGTGVLK